MQCLVLAGGLGTRMAPVTERVPKCLLEVAGRPFAHWQLEWLAAQGVRRVVFSIGHLGEAVRAELGDGGRFGVELTYVDEGPVLLGTGGALRLAVERGVTEASFFVLYGDSYLTVDLAAVARAFTDRRAEALMTVFRNRGRWERSNAVFDGESVVRYDKTLAEPPPEMAWVDYGLSVLSSAVVLETVPAGGPSDLADALHRLSIQGRLAGFEVTERFYEIGSPSGHAELEALLRGRAGAGSSAS